MSGKARLTPKLKDRVSPRSDPQQERSRNRQQALLDAAEEVLAEVGAEGVRMREVARRAHLPIASVYHYFPSAQALIRTLVERLLDELRSVLTAGLASVGGGRGRSRSRGCADRHRRRRGRLHGKPPQPADPVGRDARLSGLARARHRRRGRERPPARPRPYRAVAESFTRRGRGARPGRRRGRVVGAAARVRSFRRRSGG